MPSRRSPAVVLLAALSWAAAAPAQPAAAWEFRVSEAVDLWYYGLATVGFAGPGTTPYYDSDFARAVREERRARGLGPSRLEAGASALAMELGRDTVFESLHFLPLYFHGDGRQLIASMRSIVTGAAGPPQTARDRDGAATRAVAQVIVTPAQRASLGRFVDALEDARPAFVRSRARDDATRPSRLLALSGRWNGDFLPVLEPYLRAIGVRGATVIVSPALGGEGRIIRDAGRAVIAVGWSATDSPDAAVFAVVRELCFPLIEHLAAPATLPRREAIELASRAAVRCGAMVLDAAAPPMGDDYRRSYLGRTTTGPGLLREFDARFPLAPALEQSLRGNVDRAMSGARMTRQ